jgi:DNA-binding MarR family transcriptional regulator
MRGADDSGPPVAKRWAAVPIDQRPGYLIRRLHQIHSVLFAEEVAPDRVTPIMYSVLSALRQLGAVDQKTLGAAVAVDKTNMADILERLRGRGLVTRRVSPHDGRVRLTELTPDGIALLGRIDAKAETAHTRTIDVLSDEEQALFVTMMRRIVSAKVQPVAGSKDPMADARAPADGAAS